MTKTPTLADSFAGESDAVADPPLQIPPSALLYRAQVKPCYRTPRSTQACSICGDKARQMHMPLGRVGHFCAHCCPACAAGTLSAAAGTSSPGNRSKTRS